MPENSELIGDLTREEKIKFLRDLKEARLSGVSRVKFKERDVTYRSDAEMARVIADLERQLLGRKRKHVGLTTFSRGY